MKDARPYTAVPAVVYIARSAEGQVLYVGVTRNLTARMAAHKSRRRWWSPDVQVSVEHFDHRGDAERRERELIEQLNPPFNPDRRFVLAITGELRNQVELLAADLGIPARSLVEEAMRREMARRERQQKS